MKDKKVKLDIGKDKKVKLDFFLEGKVAISAYTLYVIFGINPTSSYDYGSSFDGVIEIHHYMVDSGILNECGEGLFKKFLLNVDRREEFESLLEINKL